ncbi:unnamed protein product [Didymodactylos carnosus]|uniref:palmitoyl-protein hydrolase n=1 Tax=Didymodactylos carnosus TaxID=1234261 RepID=A0A813YPP5_9BILA|nr:unnamed protein product [Didymodactylos carnosus]CAF1148596.1 unnamed protein product [Didymodactylos carnosus]CAF3672716.1 unnamed protein product [Didymodactylos carnosus]CAF3952851.1 unnamed protein product [Didymodactylos carnosus]
MENCHNTWLLSNCVSSRANQLSDQTEQPESNTKENSDKQQKILKEMSRDIIPAAIKHTASLIFLHGLGDVGPSWLQAFKMYRIPEKTPHVKYIFPTAAIRKVTLNFGMEMTSWFDVKGLSRNAVEDTEGIETSTKLCTSKILELVNKEIESGIPPERIIVGGFSMGGAVALHTALAAPWLLGGCIALSSWLPLANTFPDAIKAADQKINLPILQCHGKQDPLVQIEWAKLTSQALESFGFKNYQFHEYNMEHSSCDKEINDVSEFILRVLSDNK